MEIATPYGQVPIEYCDLLVSTSEEIALSQLAASKLEGTNAASEAKSKVLDSIRIAAKISQQLANFALPKDNLIAQLLSICRSVDATLVEQFEHRLSTEPIDKPFNVARIVEAMLATIPQSDEPANDIQD